MARPVVDFPQPDSPNEPERLSTLEAEANAIHSPDLIHATPQNPAMNGEIFLQVLNVEKRLRVGCTISVHRRLHPIR